MEEGIRPIHGLTSRLWRLAGDCPVRAREGAPGRSGLTAPLRGEEVGRAVAAGLVLEDGQGVDHQA